MNFENQIIIGTGCDIPSLLLICNDSKKKLRCGEKPNISSVYVRDCSTHVGWYLNDKIS